MLRLHELGALAMAGGSTERQSLLGQLRMISAAGAEEVYGYERWEGLRLATGSASLALRMAADLGDRVRLGAQVAALHVAPGGVRRDAGRRGGAAPPRRSSARCRSGRCATSRSRA